MNTINSFEEEMWPEFCWCGIKAQGKNAGDHICRQCTAHCEIERHRAGQAPIDPRYATHCWLEGDLREELW